MALRPQLALVVLALAETTTATNSGFANSNPIRPVTDRVASALESTVFVALGRTLDALHFAIRYGKSYKSVAEVQKRFRIFSESLQLVRSTNWKGLYYRLDINHFTDINWEEFRATRLGAAQKCSATLAGNHLMRVAAAAALTKMKDWR
jgi:cathepsin H